MELTVGCCKHPRALAWEFAIDGANVHFCFDLEMSELIGIDRIGRVEESAVGSFLTLKSTISFLLIFFFLVDSQSSIS